jgi:predicted O-methyltransferase YrrM
MGLDKFNQYIEGLYQGRVVDRERYIADSTITEFVSVISEDTARLLQLLLHVTRAQRVLELGTSIGYSSAVMAQVVQNYGGKITTIDVDERVVEQARRNFQRLGVDETIQVMVGDVRALVPLLTGDFDLILIDADKHLYPQMLEPCVRLLRRGGILAIDDTLFPAMDLGPTAQHLIPPIEAFNQLILECDVLESTLLPIGDGLTIAIKK